MKNSNIYFAIFILVKDCNIISTTVLRCTTLLTSASQFSGMLTQSQQQLNLVSLVKVQNITG